MSEKMYISNYYNYVGGGEPLPNSILVLLNLRMLNEKLIKTK